VEAASATDGTNGATMEEYMKKELWAGVVGNSIEFFQHNPNGNVQGLSGTRKFYLEGDNLTDDTGGTIINNIANESEANGNQTETVSSSQMPPQTA
jgi:hypothetical protein